MMSNFDRPKIHVTKARPTKEAVAAFRRNTQSFDAIITDIGRVEDGKRNPDAGVILTKGVREIDQKVPILVVTTPKSVQFRGDELKELGVGLVTSSSSDLLASLQQLGFHISPPRYQA